MLKFLKCNEDFKNVYLNFYQYLPFTFLGYFNGDEVK